MNLKELRENKAFVYAFLAIVFFIPGLAYQCAFHMDQLIEATLLVKIAAIISKSVIFFMISFLYEILVSGIKIKNGKYSEAAVNKTVLLTSIDILFCSFISMIIVWVLTFFMALGNEYQYLRIVATYAILHLIMFIFEIVFKKKEKKNNKQKSVKRKNRKMRKK